MYLRVVRFRPMDAGVLADRFLRESVEPGLLAMDGLRYVYSGRGVQSGAEERVMVSVWEQPDADLLRDALSFEVAHNGELPDVDLRELTVSAVFDEVEEPHILRVFRGRVAPGEADAYVDAARRGTYDDHDAGRGPQALFLGARGDDVTTVSVWSDWDRVGQSTGGNLRQPIATRHTEQLPEWSAEHYEILPRSLAGSVRAPSPMALDSQSAATTTE